MSREHVRRNLEAVEQALTHFATALKQAGFGVGAATYLQMAKVISDQWLWAEKAGSEDLYPKFRRVAELARTVEEQIVPYVQAMRWLVVLEESIPPLSPGNPASVAERIVDVLRANRQPMSATAIRSRLSEPTEVVRRELTKLVEQRLVIASGSSSRTVYKPSRNLH